MAENKKSFLLYTDVYHTVKKLTDEQAGKLFKHILGYVNDENPCLNDILLEIAFEPIKQSLKRDLRKYKAIREKRSYAGKVSADKRQQMSTCVESDEQNEQVSTNSTVSVSVSVNDNVSDNKNKIIIPQLSVSDEFSKKDFIDLIIQKFTEEYFKKYGIEYIVTAKGKDRAAAGKLASIYKKKYPDSKSEETLTDLAAYFSQVLSIDDSFLQNNMSLPLILSKFNDINKILKNGKYRENSNKGATAAELTAIVSKHFDVKQ